MCHVVLRPAYGKNGSHKVQELQPHQLVAQPVDHTTFLLTRRKPVMHDLPLEVLYSRRFEYV